MPYDGILAARGLSPLLAIANRSGDNPVTSSCLRAEQSTPCSRAEYVHIKLVNVREEEATLPKATLVGVAEKISTSLVAAINDDASPADREKAC
jgi:hypothetical protein